MEKQGIPVLFLLLLFLLPLQLYGQTRIIAGKIKKNNIAQTSVPVTLYNAEKDHRYGPSVTNAKGSYYFYNVPEGTYKLEIWIYGRVGKKKPIERTKKIDYDNAKKNSDHIILRLKTINL